MKTKVRLVLSLTFTVKNISLEEKKKFLEGKLTEEEIAETLKRYSEQK